MRFERIAALYFRLVCLETQPETRQRQWGGGKEPRKKFCLRNKRKKATVAQLPRGCICFLSHRIKNTTCSKVRYSCVVSPHCEVLLSTREEVTANNDLFLRGDREGRVQTLRTIPDIESRRQHAGLQLFHGKNIHNGGRLHVSASKAKLPHRVKLHRQHRT